MEPSQTAQLAAAHRAYHLMKAQPALLEDSAAIWLLGPPLNVILRVGLLRKLFWERLLARVGPISAFIVIRVFEDLSAAEIRRRYLEGRTDGMDIPSYVRLGSTQRC